MTVVFIIGKQVRWALVPLGQFECDLIFSVAFVHVDKTIYNSGTGKPWLF